LCKSPPSPQPTNNLLTHHPPPSSWLFASSLVLGVGLLGGFGRILEKHCRASIAALEHLAQADAHAAQYALIARSLLATALLYLERREVRERQLRTESSALLFGLVPRALREGGGHGSGHGSGGGRSGSSGSGLGGSSWEGGESPQKGGGVHRARTGHDDDGGGGQEPRFGFDFESTFLGLAAADTLPRTPDFSLLGGHHLDGDAEGTFGAMNLFPLLETDGHIDLANYF
jgi:hypothetical protein